MLNLLRDKNFAACLLTILLFLLLYPAVSLKIPPIHIGRLKMQDLFFEMRYRLKGPPPEVDKITIISIDDESFRLMNKKWPWSRALFAILVEKLKDSSPALVCLDIAFVGKEADPATDQSLIAAIKDAGNVMLASYFSNKGKYILPDREIRESALAFGFINKPRDIDYITRRASPLMCTVGGRIIDYSLAFKAAAWSLGVPFRNISHNPSNRDITLKTKDASKEYTFKLAEHNTIGVNYSAKPESFRIIPFWRVVAEKSDASAFKDKIVFLGMTSEIFHDTYNTPLGYMPGVLVNINEFLTYISGKPILRVSGMVTFWIRLLFALTILVVTYRLGMLKGFLTAIGILLGAFLATLYLLFKNYSFDFFGIFLIGVGSYLTTYAYSSLGLLITNMMLRKEAITDGLTGLYVFRYFSLIIRNEFKKSKITKNPLALLIIDVDDFKKINDTYSHQTGNAVLRELARLMHATSRKTDTLFRYGGEEFCAVTLNTETEGVVKYAEKLRSTIETHDFIAPKGAIKVTVSIGIATTERGDVNSAEDLIKRADAALYRAKGAGKNKAILY